MPVNLASAIPMDSASFGAPWHARIWGLAVHLHQQGAFTWPEWVKTFSTAVATISPEPGECVNDTYYRQWAAALEKLLACKGIMTSDILGARQVAWGQAHANTPHGMPVLLENGQASYVPPAMPRSTPRGRPIFVSPPTTK
ncbi:nitrile hydratase accessory protein [Asaia sp. VD9]|uniref:nitrile hydratase accessory protein n=1 Tax=Asaia sp. VD9 TaxID=3081235 RepID=UPI0030182FE6